MTKREAINDRKPSANSRFEKAEVSYFNESEVLNSYNQKNIQQIHSPFDDL